MPRFDCSICHEDIIYPACDEAVHRARHWECPMCYSVIAKKRYDVNIPGAVTMFSQMGDALGDRVVQEVIVRCYKRDNPDEEVIQLGSMPLQDWHTAFQRKVTKVFWADVTNFMKPPPGSIWFSLCNEANQFARQGEYPRLWFDPVQPEVFKDGLDKDRKSVVLHVRNVRKGGCKNMTSEELRAIIEALQDQFIIIVGNDVPLDAEGHVENDGLLEDVLDFSKWFNVHDLRMVLKLEEIAWVLQRCSLFVGKDSGIAHLAAAAGAKGVSFNYGTHKWYPKAPPGKWRAYTVQEKFTNVLDSIREHIKSGGAHDWGKERGL